MSKLINDYYEALNRLQTRQTLNVPKGTRISKDSVALEAGRGRGCIKKSRPAFHDLIMAIDAAALTQTKLETNSKLKEANYRNSAEKYRKLWEEALARELSLIHELRELKAELSKLNSNKISSFTN